MSCFSKMSPAFGIKSELGPGAVCISATIRSVATLFDAGGRGGLTGWLFTEYETGWLPEVANGPKVMVPPADALTPNGANIEEF